MADALAEATNQGSSNIFGIDLPVQMPAWASFLLLIAGLAYAITKQWPNIQHLINDILPAKRQILRLRGQLELRKLICEIEGLKKSHGINDDTIEKYLRATETEVIKIYNTGRHAYASVKQRRVLACGVGGFLSGFLFVVAFAILEMLVTGDLRDGYLAAFYFALAAGTICAVTGLLLGAIPWPNLRKTSEYFCVGMFVSLGWMVIGALFDYLGRFISFLGSLVS